MSRRSARGWLTSALRRFGLPMLVALAPAGLYWRVVAPGGLRRTFPAGDFIDQFYAFAAFEVRSLAAGRLPEWNPYAYAGSPFWADVQAAMAYPPRLAHALFWAVTRGRLPLVALELEAIAHLALASLLTYWLARELTGSRLAAAVAGLTFGLGGYLQGYPREQLAVLESAAWLPLALMGVERVVREPRAPGAVAMLAAGLALTMLAGHPQTGLFVAYTTAAYAGWRLWPWRRGTRAWAALTAAAGLATAAAAASWLPAAEYLRLSDRPKLGYEELAAGFPPHELLGLIVPGITRWSPLYVGALPLLLAAGAIVAAARGLNGGAAHARANPAFWTGLAVVGLLLSLGRSGPLFDLFYVFVPGFGLFRGQERAALLVSFGLAMLAGWGARQWRDGDTASRAVMAWGAMALAALGLIWMAATPDGKVAGLRLVLVAAAAAALAAFGPGSQSSEPDEPRLRRRRGLLAEPRGAGALALGLIVLDLALALPSSSLVASRPSELAVSPVVSALREDAEGRVQNDYRLPGNFGVLHGIEATSGASPLWPASFGELRDGLAGNEARLWQLLGVSHVVTWRGELPVPARQLIDVSSGEEITHVFRLNLTGPRVWRVTTAVVEPDPAAALARIGSDEFDPRNEVVLADGPGGAYPMTVGTLVEGERAPGSLGVTVDGDAPTWVVVSEMAYPGWEARIDGRPARLRRANVALMAIEVPPGRHDVTFRFRSSTVRVGLILSVAGWLAIGWLAGQGRRRATST